MDFKAVHTSSGNSFRGLAEGFDHSDELGVGGCAGLVGAAGFGLLDAYSDWAVVASFAADGRWSLFVASFTIQLICGFLGEPALPAVDRGIPCQVGAAAAGKRRR